MNPPKGGSDTLLQLQELIPTVQVPAKKVSSVQGSGFEVFTSMFEWTNTILTTRCLDPTGGTGD